MDPLEPGVAAVEMPRVRSLASSAARIRRHRRVTGMSGILLFACLFLPAVDACGAVEPYQLPPLAPPYLYGLVFALIALARTPRGLAHGIAALRALSVLVMVSGVLVAAIVPEVGLPEIAVGVVLLLIVGLARTAEPQVAASAIAVAAVSMLWFGVWCLDDSALLGAYLSLASATGLALGGFLWWRELAARPSIVVPAAVARRGMISSLR